MVTGQSDTVVIVLAALGFLTSVITAGIAAWVGVKTRAVDSTVKAVETKVDGTATLLQERLKVAEAGQNAAEGFTLGEQAQRDRTPPPGA